MPIWITKLFIYVIKILIVICIFICCFTIIYIIKKFINLLVRKKYIDSNTDYKYYKIPKKRVDVLQEFTKYFKELKCSRSILSGGYRVYPQVISIDATITNGSNIDCLHFTISANVMKVI